MRFPFSAALTLFTLGCASDEGIKIERTREELLDPETCKECHPKHYEEWSGSMHAYAAEDPVFRAMNARGQEETRDREQPLGDFCVSCHAPMAVREGATTDGLNLDDVPKHLQGVTCYFCHNVVAVEGEHNNPLVLADDRTMRGSIRDPLENTAHRAEYSELLDGQSRESSKMCGACHDIVVPKEVTGNDEDVHLERTFTEYQDNLFDKPIEEGGLTCGGCHTPISPSGLQPIAEYDGVQSRIRHLHAFPGVDVAITEFPDQIEAVRQLLDPSIRTTLCVNEYGNIDVELDNFIAGHSYPSGASQDRRFWAEVIAYDAAGNILDAWGKVEPGQPVTSLDPAPSLLFRDITTKADGSVAHMFWDVANVDIGTIPGAKTLDPTLFDEEGNQLLARPIVSRSFTTSADFHRVTVRLRIEPIGLDVLDDLVSSGHLSQAHRDAHVVHDILPNRDVSPESGLAPDVTVQLVRPERFTAERVCVESADTGQLDADAGP